jgi:hypothetical protein
MSAIEMSATSRIASPETNKTLEGILIEEKQPSNAPDSMCFSREPGAKEIDESEEQDEKHDDPRTSTFGGMVMDRSEERENVCSSSRIKREFDSNERDESNLHHEKHDDPTISTVCGMSIDGSDDEKNAFDSI